MRQNGIIAFVVAVLALFVSAQTTDNQLTDLEDTVRALQTELKLLQLKVDATSQLDERVGLIEAAVFGGAEQESGDDGHRRPRRDDDRDDVRTHSFGTTTYTPSTPSWNTAPSAAANAQALAVLRGEVNYNKSMLTWISDSLMQQNTEMLNVKLTVNSVSSQMSIIDSKFGLSEGLMTQLNGKIATMQSSLSESTLGLNAIHLELHQHEAKITLIESRVTANTAQINAGTQPSGADAGAMAALAARVAALEAMSTNYQAQISANTAGVSQNANGIAANMLSLTAHATAISTHMHSGSGSGSNADPADSAWGRSLAAAVSTNAVAISSCMAGISANSVAIVTSGTGVNTNALAISANLAGIQANSAYISTHLVGHGTGGGGDPDPNPNPNPNPNPDPVVDCATNGPTLRKLPVWGRKSNHSSSATHFEWPTMDDLAEMDNCGLDATVTSMYFESFAPQNGNSISKIQIHLSNGVSSPIFYNDEFPTYNPTTIEFDDPRPVRQVAAYDGPNYVHTIKFNDASGDLIYSFNPFDYTYATRSPDLLKENEELIGVYGVYTEYWFDAMGFIVKVTDQGN